MNEEYMGFCLINVYNNVDSSLKNEIIALWTGNRAVPPEEAERRVEEVVYIIRNPDGMIAGVSTVYLQKFIAGVLPFYFMRMFIRPEDRGHLGLYRLVSWKTREFLKTYKRLESTPKGVIIIIENPKFLGRGNKKSLEERGWTYYGKGPLGNHIWYECFDGSLLTKPEQRFTL
jgi:hypothetical protein